MVRHRPWYESTHVDLYGPPDRPNKLVGAELAQLQGPAREAKSAPFLPVTPVRARIPPAFLLVQHTYAYVPRN
jgi:hypothetical protein